MNKTDLLRWLDREIEGWETFLNDVGRDRLELPDANVPWSMKDVIAHLTEWTRRHVARMDAALRGQPEPPTAWPAGLQEDDGVNAWIYAAHKDRSLEAVLDDSRETLRQLRAVLEALPNDTRIDDSYRQVHIGDRTFAAGDFFDHFHDDHEPGIRAWLARQAQVPGR